MKPGWSNASQALLLGVFLWMCPQLGSADVPTDTHMLSPEQQRWLAEHPVVRYTVFPGLHPMEDVEEGRPTGIVPAYVQMIGRDTGITFEYVPTHSWNEAVERFRRGDIDVLPNVTPELAAAISPTEALVTLPYFSTPLVAIARANSPIVTTTDKLAGKTVAVRAREGLQSLSLPGVKSLQYSSTAGMLNAVSTGAVDYAIGAEAIYPPVVRSRHVGELGIAGYLDKMPIESRMLVLKKNAMLFGILNHAIASLTAEETDLLYLHWLERVEYGAPNAQAIWRYLGLEVALLGFMLLALSAAVIWAIRARASARSSEAAKARFLAMMSHEVRTPVNIMVGTMEAFERTGLNERQADMLRVVSASADALVDLLNNVLDLSKLDERQLTLEPISTIAEHVLVEIASLTRVQALSKGVSLHLQMQGLEGVSMRIDPTRLRQILNNLLSNAVKFTEQGEISINASLSREQSEHFLCVSVSDTGIGIPKGQQAHLFNPYTQADSSISRRYGGTGLGLSLCKLLVELMGGRIEMESQVGVGTTVRLRLPVQLDQVPAASLHDVEPRSGNEEPCAHVMIVDDVLLNATVLQDQLASIGLTSSIYVDANTAIVALAEHHFDLVLMDCNMPGVSGYEAVRHIKDEKLSDVPIIAISASTGADHQSRCAAAGFDGTLSKPLRTKAVVNLLDLWGVPHGNTVAAATESSRQMPDFLDVLSTDWQELRRSIQSGTHGAIEHHAHRIKGVALVFGNDGLAALASKVESYAVARRPVPTPLLQEMESCLMQSYPGLD